MTKKFVIVGAGYSGLKALNWLLSKGESNILILESEDFVGGRSKSGLHTVSPSFPNGFFAHDFVINTSLVRWNKEWTQFENVDWEDKSWSQILPQWNDYFIQKQRALDELVIQEEIIEKVQLNTPIQNILRSADGNWELQTPTESIFAENVIWCAPMNSLQLCLGKIGTQQYCSANPKFDEKSQEFKGGLAFDWIYSKAPEMFDLEFKETLLGIPVRHQAKLYLSLALCMPEGDSFALQTLTYLPDDLLVSPKQVLSFQKSLRRTLRQFLKEDFQNPTRERWIVSPEIRGAVYAKPWVLKSQKQKNIFFVGEDTESAAQSSFTGLESIEASLNSLFIDLEYKLDAQEQNSDTDATTELSC